MTTHSNYSLQNFSTNNAKVLTENSQPVLDFKFNTQIMLYSKASRYMVFGSRKKKRAAQNRTS